MKIDLATVLLLVSGCLISSSLVAPVQAAEQIILEYEDWEVELTLQELQEPSLGERLPSLIPQLKGSDIRVFQGAQSLLVQDFKVPLVIDQFLESFTGQFALQVLDGIILNQKSGLQNNLSALKTAIGMAAADRELSLIDLLRAYPQEQVNVDVNQLTHTVEEVKGFVARSQPALSMAQDMLTEFVCKCEASTQTVSDNFSSIDCAHPTEQGSPHRESGEKMGQVQDD